MPSALSTSLAIILALHTVVAVCCAEIPDAVTEKVLTGDWEAVHAALSADDSQATDPIARLLCAHACIATNHNNDSFLLFMSLRQPDAARACAEWAQGLAGRYPDNGVARYLVGDAMARVGRLREAILSFDAALDIEPSLGLAWSARGAARSLTRDMEGALLDLHQATQVAPNLADAHANLGTLWVLQGASTGAVESYDRAIQIDPDFALAYNGRGCARFGRGDYDAAIADLEKAFELCPALVPAGANEAVILAALAAEVAPQIATKRPGTMILTKSELGNVDFTRLRTAQEIMNFDQSVRRLADTDYVDALRVVAAQRVALSAARQDLIGDLSRTVQTTAKADDLERGLQMTDTFLGLIPVSGPKASLIPGPRSGWKQVFDMAGVGSEMLSDATPSTAAGMWTELAKRTLDPDLASPAGPLKALVHSATYLLSEEATTLRMYGEARSVRLSADLQTLNIRDTHLHGLQQSLLTKGLQEGFDFGKPDLLEGVLRSRRLDRGHPPLGHALGPLREYRIPAMAPVSAFGTLPRAAGQVAAAGQKAFVLIDGAEFTDPIRLGTALRAYESLGALTIPVPKGIDAARWASALSLSPSQTIVAKITADPTQTHIPRQIDFGTSGPPGGVTTDMSGVHIDRGDWPVMTTFALAYSAGNTP